jgi:sensor histidine kinase YesM
MKPDIDTRTYRNDYLLRFSTSSRYKIHRHIALLIFLTAAFANSKDILVEPFNTYFKFTFFCVLVLFFYLNMNWLIPRYVFKEKYLSYFLWVMLLFGLVFLMTIGAKYMLKPYFKLGHNEGIDDFNIVAFTFVFFIFIAASAAIKLFQRSLVMNQRVNELETATMKSELEQLKNQINPHFLFNMLNNANVLTKKDPVKASEVLMKLSDLLRYQLYDSARDKVLLTADIHFIEDFLNLEKIRRDNFEFVVSKEGDLSGVRVPPLLFITFVENAVKHNVDAEKPSYVHVYFNVRHNELNFSCINSKPQIEVAKRSVGGLGLANVSRRLKLLYPEKHILYIKNGDDLFNIELNIKL